MAEIVGRVSDVEEKIPCIERRTQCTRLLCPPTVQAFRFSARTLDGSTTAETTAKHVAGSYLVICSSENRFIEHATQKKKEKTRK